ncbi:MAG: hypothetical protein GWP03_00035 [Proteobacteria bacterium]|nr:hypothetical protein [Pseudomonadota bacterium]
MRRRKRPTSSSIPTASTGDIAFLLLVFFMTTTIFNNELGLQIVLPEKGETVKVKSSSIAHVYVARDGSVKIDGKKTPIDKIEDSAINLLTKGHTEKVDTNLIFSMKTSRFCKYGVMITVFDNLKKAFNTLNVPEKISLKPSPISEEF